MGRSIDLDSLSFDAKAIAGGWFGMMVPGKGDLTFQLREVRPTDRAIDALCELVRAGCISVEPFNRFGGVVYRPLVDCRPAFEWLGKQIDNPEIKFPITEALDSEKVRKALRKRMLGERA